MWLTFSWQPKRKRTPPSFFTDYTQLFFLIIYYILPPQLLQLLYNTPSLRNLGMWSCEQLSPKNLANKDVSCLSVSYFLQSSYIMIFEKTPVIIIIIYFSIGLVVYPGFHLTNGAGTFCCRSFHSSSIVSDHFVRVCRKFCNYYSTNAWIYIPVFNHLI